MTEAEDHFIASAGMRIHVTVTGSGPPVVLLHGFLGSAESWSSLVSLLSHDYRCICPDLLGHGRSDVSPEPGRYAIERQARDMKTVLAALAPDGPALLGYSMGGRIALHMAMDTPVLIRLLICESTSPGIGDPEERKRRVGRDDELARHIARDGMAAFVETWEAMPIFSGHPHLDDASRARLRSQRLAVSPVAAMAALRGASPGRTASMWSGLSQVNLPVGIVAGADDGQYRAIGERMRALMPRAELHVIPSAGHMAHLDQPQRFLAVVELFLDCHLREESTAQDDLAGH